MNFIAIMAQQRSGTHFLGTAIGSHPDIEYTGELFCRDIPHTERQMIDQIGRVVGDTRVVCLDCKYNQISAPVEAFLARHEVKVIHLVRRDRLAAYFSGELHTWRGEHPDSGHTPTFDFDLRKYNEIEQSVEWHQRRLGYLTDLKLYYEDLTGNRDTIGLPHWANRMICTLAHVDIRQLTTSHGKEAPVNYRDYLVNVPPTVMGWSLEAHPPRLGQ
jgi:hypothetical protein